MLFTNQLRSVIKTSQYQPGPNETTSGGKALKYYTHVRIHLKKQKIEEVSSKNMVTGKNEKEPINQIIKAIIKKNKVDRPYLSGPVYIRFGEGFDNIMSMIELAVNTNVIKKKGAFFKFDLNGETLFNVQGKEKLRDLLTNNSDIYQKLTQNLTFNEDKEARQEAEVSGENEGEDIGDELVKILDPEEENEE